MRQRYETLNVIELDSERLLSNLELFHRYTGDKIIPVLKSNAYGHGIKQVAKILDGSNHEIVAVDSYYEANEILKNTRSLKILVLGLVPPNNLRLLNTKRISYVAQTIEDIQAFARLRRHIQIHLELNTGMNRLGILPSEVDDYLAELKKHKNLELEGIMTHLADADSKKTSFTNYQVNLFDSSVKHILESGFHPRYIHIAQTAGSLKIKSRYSNAVRVGIGTYGINPLDKKDPVWSKLADLQPVLELKSTIVKVIDLDKGDKVSYSLTFAAKKKMRIGILPLGYYEALPRVLSNSAHLTTLSGDKLPVVGRICMNHTMIDLTDTNLSTGDQVIVISKNPSAPNSVEGIRKNHQVFPYELLCKLSSITRRQIV